MAGFKQFLISNLRRDFPISTLFRMQGTERWMASKQNKSQSLSKVKKTLPAAQEYWNGFIYLSFTVRNFRLIVLLGTLLRGILLVLAGNHTMRFYLGTFIS